VHPTLLPSAATAPALRAGRRCARTDHARPLPARRRGPASRLPVRPPPLPSSALLPAPTLQPAAEGEEGGGAGGGRWEGMGPVVEPPCRFCSLACLASSLAPLQLLEALDREEQRKGAE